ncbi:MAG TPA: hypothetical protein VF043_02720 [Ktedonobacteraceae bacterium]
MNLWAEFDDNPDSPLPTLRQPHARRLTENAVQIAVRDWLLHEYAASYCRSLAATRIFRRCYWVDALGTHSRVQNNTVIPTPASLINDSPAIPPGKGRQKEAKQQVPLMLQPIHELSRALAQESRPITLHGLILEAGSGKRTGAKTGQNDQHAPKKGPVLPKEGGLVHAGWLEAAPALLQTIDQSAAIFLLQPFGKTIFSHQDLAPLYTRTAPTELCLLISHKQVEVHLLPSLHTPTGASAFTALLRNDRWKALLTGDQDIEHIINALINALIASMQQHFLAVQPIALPMQVSPAVVELAPATLVFATRRQDSLACMNDAICLYRRRLDQQSHRGVLMENWFAMQQQQRLDDQFQLLYERVLQAGQTQRTRRWPELRQRLLLANFGQYTINDYDQVINRLLSSGKVRCEWRQVSPVNAGGEEQRIPGNEDTLLWM